MTNTTDSKTVFQWDENMYKDAMSYMAAEYPDFWARLDKFKKLTILSVPPLVAITRLMIKVLL